MFNEISAEIEACKAFWNGYKWMKDFGQRIAETSTKEEMLACRHRLLDMKQEMLNLQQAFLQEQQSKHRLLRFDIFLQNPANSCIIAHSVCELSSNHS